MAIEDAGLGHRGREVEGRLAAEPREQALWLLLGDDGLDRFHGQWLQVDHVGDLRVGHDRGGVRVDEDRPDALGAKRSAGLRAGIVELGGLADDHRAGPEDQDRCRLARFGDHAALARGRVPWSTSFVVARLTGSASSRQAARAALPGRAALPSRAADSPANSRLTGDDISRLRSRLRVATVGRITCEPRRSRIDRTPRARRVVRGRLRGGTGRSRSATRGGEGPRRTDH